MSYGQVTFGANGVPQGTQLAVDQIDGKIYQIVKIAHPDEGNPDPYREFTVQPRSSSANGFNTDEQVDAIAVYSSEQIDLGAGKGFLMWLKTTDNPGGGETLTLDIEVNAGWDILDPVDWIPWVPAGIVITAANETKGILLFLGALAADAPPAVAVIGLPCPRFFRIKVTPSVLGAGHEWTFRVMGEFLNSW